MIFSISKVLDNHVIDYIPPNILVQKGTVDRTKNGLLGMAIVGALSCDPRNVKNVLIHVPPKGLVTELYSSETDS